MVPGLIYLSGYRPGCHHVGGGLAVHPGFFSRGG